jgi:hypothetical protein
VLVEERDLPLESFGIRHIIGVHTRQQRARGMLRREVERTNYSLMINGIHPHAGVASRPGIEDFIRAICGPIANGYYVKICVRLRLQRINSGLECIIGVTTREKYGHTRRRILH